MAMTEQQIQLVVAAQGADIKSFEELFAIYLLNRQVNYETFRDTIIPAIENNETWKTFVKVTVSGENIVKVEWTYLP